MGRYETLNDDTKDMVDAMLPSIAKAFGIDVDNFKDIVPADIRMRAWDCDRRDHIKDKTEDDPRNWGVQFLKDLQSIARLIKNDLAKFQADLRAKVEKHKAKHPWTRLADIKELKVKYQKPGQESSEEQSQDEFVSEGDSSTDSYLEELVEPDLPKDGKRRRRNHEMYETRVQGSGKRRKHGSTSSRLRRGDSAGWGRHEKAPRYSKGRYSIERHSPVPARGIARYLGSDIGHREDSYEAMSFMIENSDQPLEVLKLQAELEAAEAELKVARTRLAYIDAKDREDKKKAVRNSNGPSELRRSFGH